MSAYEQCNKTFEDDLIYQFHHGMIPITSGETHQGAELFTNGVEKHGEIAADLIYFKV